MGFTTEAWSAAADVLGAIEKHPFVTGLADGTLSEERFAFYMAQGSHTPEEIVATSGRRRPRPDSQDRTKRRLLPSAGRSGPRFGRPSVLRR
jgi:hypothetical protein